jgi:HEAT repeat protein
VLLLAGAAVAVCGGAFYLSLPPGPEVPSAPTTEPAVGTAAHATESTPTPPPTEPAEETDETPAVNIEGLRAGLNSTYRVQRKGALREIRRLGPEATPLLEDIKKFIGGPDEILSNMAKSASMRITGTREYLIELAESGTGSQVTWVAPEMGLVLVGALGYRKSDPGPGSEVQQLIDLIVGNDPGAREFVLDRVRRDEGTPLRKWMGLALKIRPIPDGLGDILAAKLRQGTVTGTQELLRSMSYIKRESPEARAIGPAVVPVLINLLPDPRRRGYALKGISALAEESSGVTDALRGELQADDGRALAAVMTIAALRRDAVDLAPDLADLARRSTGRLRSETILALGATGSPAGLPIYDEILRAKADPLAVKVPSFAFAADPTFEDPVGLDLQIRALGDPRPAVRKAAARFFGYCRTVPDDLSAAFVAVVFDPDEDVSRAAGAVVGPLWKRFSKGCPFVPTLIAVVESPLADTHPEGDQRRRSAAHALKYVAPYDETGRKWLLGAISHGHAYVREQAARGVTRIKEPTDEERAALKAALDSPDRKVRAVAGSAFRRPPYEE